MINICYICLFKVKKEGEESPGVVSHVKCNSLKIHSFISKWIHCIKTID